MMALEVKFGTVETMKVTLSDLDVMVKRGQASPFFWYESCLYCLGDRVAPKKKAMKKRPAKATVRIPANELWACRFLWSVDDEFPQGETFAGDIEVLPVKSAEITVPEYPAPNE